MQTTFRSIIVSIYHLLIFIILLTDNFNRIDTDKEQSYDDDKLVDKKKSLNKNNKFIYVNKQNRRHHRTSTNEPFKLVSLSYFQRKKHEFFGENLVILQWNQKRIRDQKKYWKPLVGFERWKHFYNQRFDEGTVPLRYLYAFSFAYSLGYVIVPKMVFLFTGPLGTAALQMICAILEKVFSIFELAGWYGLYILNYIIMYFFKAFGITIGLIGMKSTNDTTGLTSKSETKPTDPWYEMIDEQHNKWTVHVIPYTGPSYIISPIVWRLDSKWLIIILEFISITAITAIIYGYRHEMMLKRKRDKINKVSNSKIIQMKTKPHIKTRQTRRKNSLQQKLRKYL